MDAIDLMMEEHKNIKRMLRVIRILCMKLLHNEEVDLENFDNIIGFVRNYADKHHHNKEEVILFKKMGEYLGERVSQGPVAGMLIEHDQGRVFISSLEEAVKRVKEGDNDSRVDIIGNAIAYSDLLTRHIERENTALYTFARRALKPEAIKEIEDLCKDVEEAAVKSGTQNKYLAILEDLERQNGL